MTHELKTWPEYFEPIRREDKRFELRLNDRDYKTGDILVLAEWNPKTKEFTGRVCDRIVDYILNGLAFGLAEGWCIMSIS